MLSQVHFAMVGGEVQYDNNINKRFNKVFSLMVCIVYRVVKRSGVSPPGFMLLIIFHEAYDTALCVLVEWFATLCTAKFDISSA